jgi:LmbE family N-acetylglucosaminyl deacetylase
MAKKDTILVLCAHNDDQIIGVGGTMVKYAREGKKVITVIFSFGELSHPHLKTEVITKTRIKESMESEKILGGSGIKYLGLTEHQCANMLKNEEKKEKIKRIIKKIIEKESPSKIFTHSRDDPHTLHRNVYRLVMETIKEARVGGDVYSFDIWNPIKIRGRNAPKLVVDITRTFSKKIKALKSHKSQKITIISLLWNVYLKAIMQGWKNKCKYAEVFYKIA